jgi:hypothetical protein
MASDTRIARTAGILFLLTFVSAIAGAQLYTPALTDPGYVAGAGEDVRVMLGAICEIVLVITNIGTAVVLYPVLRRQHEAGALGYVAARLMECALIAVGIISVLGIVTLRRTAASGVLADPGAYDVAARTLVALHDWTFLLGPGFVVGVGNGLILGYVMYRTRLVPRWMAVTGLVGGPLLLLSGLAVMFGAYEQLSVFSVILTLPEIVWELSLGLYLTIKGFRTDTAATPSPAASSPRVGTAG